MKKALIAVAALTFAVVGCNKGRDANPISNITEAAKDVHLQNKTFSSVCSTSLGEMAKTLGTVKSSRIEYHFVGDNVTHSTVYYQSTNCTGEPAYTFKEIGTFKSDNSKDIDGGRPIDMNFKNVYVNVSSDAGRDAANSAKLCGVSNWEKGKDTDVTVHSADLTCNNAQLPRSDYNIYRLDGGTLYWGSVLPVTDEADRPTKLQKNIQFVEK